MMRHYKLCSKGFLFFSFFAIAVNAMGQERDEERKAVSTLVTQYKQFYDLVRIEGSLKKPEVFTGLFVHEDVRIPNDYFKDGTKVFKNQKQYFYDITGFLVKNDVVTLEDLVVSDEKDVLYAKGEGGVYYAWVFKAFRYTYEKEGNKKIQEDVSGWVRLAIKQVGRNDFRISSIAESTKPLDSDLDQIPDGFDKCPEQADDEDILGCPLPPTPPVRVSPIVRPPRSPEEPTGHHPPRIVVPPVQPPTVHRPPSSRFSLEVVGGGQYLLNSSFSRSDLLDYSTMTWKDSGALARKYGYSFGLALHLNMTGWLGMSVGYQQFSVPVESKKLMLQMKNYLGSNGINYGNVAISSDAYHLHLVYGTLAIGNFRSEKTVAMLEPLLGEIRTDVLPGLLGKNGLEIKTGAQAGGGNQLVTPASLSVKVDPFLAYGARGSIQFSLDEHGYTRFQLTGEYLQGKSNAAAQVITFNSLPGSIVIPAPDVRLINVSVGFHFTFNNPQR